MANDDRMTRRTALKTVTYAGGTLLIGAMGSFFLFKDRKRADDLESDLTRRIKGKIVRDNILLEEVAVDFGQVIRREPRLVMIPRVDDDVAAAFELAARYGVPVNVRGAGHTCHGQSLSDGGILILNNSDGTEVDVSGQEVTAHTRTSWMAVEQALNRKDLTSPVLTDYLDLTVGGTLSVGGYGLRSFQHGAQVDHITAMELLTADGQTLPCSPDQNSALFRYALCGLGQLGYIRKVRFKAIPYKPVTAVFYIMCESLEAFISALRVIFTGDVQTLIDHFSAYWVNGMFFLELGKSFDHASGAEIEAVGKSLAGSVQYYKQDIIKGYHLYLHNVRKQWVDQYGLSHHLWEDYMFDLASLETFLHQIVSEDRIHQQLDILPALYLMACRCNQTGPVPFAPTSGCKQEMAFSVGFYYMVKMGDAQGLERAQRQLAVNMTRCLALGGRPYLYGWHALTEQQKTAFYQDELVQLKQLKQKHDPMNLLNPGVLLQCRP